MNKYKKQNAAKKAKAVKVELKMIIHRIQKVVKVRWFQEREKLKPKLFNKILIR